MSQGQSLRHVLTHAVLCALVMGLTGCGESKPSGSAQSRIDGCVGRATSSASVALAQYGPQVRAALVNAAKGVSRGICGEAEQEGVLGADGSLEAKEARRIVQSLPELMVPYCETAVRVGLARIPPAAARYVPETPAALARRVCRIARDEGYFADGFFNPLDLERLYKSHPTLLAPVLTGSIMAGYDRNPAAVKLPRGTFLRVARRASVEAYRRGLVQVQSFLPWDYQVEHPAFDRLFAALVRQARAESSQP